MTERWNILSVILAVTLLVALSCAEAQAAQKVPLVALLLIGSRSESEPLTAAFRQGLRDLGYVEGQNIAVEFRWADLPQRLPDLATDLVRGKVDIIVTQGTPAAQAAKRATSTIPIVMATSGDPVRIGLVASLARPGGNVTGNSMLATELSGKRLELLKEIVPGVSRIAVLSNPTNPTHALFLRETEAAAKTLGVVLQVLEVRGPDDFERVFQAATSGRAGALLVLEDPVLTAHRTRLANLATKSRLPALYGLSGFAEAGGLAHYGPSLPEGFRRAAVYVDKILRGAKPGDLPIEQASKFELVINVKTAKALGLPIPQSVLLRADRVVE